jgi:hypothetical protein
MDPMLERALRGIRDAAEFAKTYRFEITDEYVELIERVESLPRNRPGTDKSGVWTADRSFRECFAKARPAASHQ